MRRFLSLAVLLVPLAVPGTNLAQSIETQTFDTEASAAAAGWQELGSRINGFDFGFSNTNNAGGDSAGEAGGMTARVGPIGYYADLDIGGVGDLSVDLAASGRIKFQDINYNAEFYLGWIDSTEETGARGNTLHYTGLEIREPSGGRWRIFAAIDEESGDQLNLDSNVAYDFNFEWDADGGAIDGDGKLTLTMTNVDSQEEFISVKEGFSAMTFDAFGLLAPDFGAGSGADQNANIWIDDLVYTTIGVPRKPGDVNRDELVNLDDFQIISDNFLLSVIRGEDGDLNFDGLVDFPDFRLWKDVFQAGGVGVAAVPEPAGVGLALVGMATALLGRRRRIHGRVRD